MERLPQDQMDLIERFHAAYNDIEKFLAEDLKPSDNRSFQAMVEDYAEKNHLLSEVAELRLYARLRNVLTHDKVRAYGYPCVPLPGTVSRLEEIRDHLLNPMRVIPTFQRPVATVDIHASLASVLRTVHVEDYSQFPVYDGDQLKGLLTENGITRWLAAYVTRELTLVELEETPISLVFENEERPNDWRIVPRNTTVDDVVVMYAECPTLEAVLISQNGRETETLLGIATRWDILQAIDTAHK